MGTGHIHLHKIREVSRICDRMHHEERAVHGVYDVKDITESDISRLMVGREVKMDLERNRPGPGMWVLRVEHLYHGYGEGKLKVNDVSFTVRQEILGHSRGGRKRAEGCWSASQACGLSREEDGIKRHDVSGMSIRNIRDIARPRIYPGQAFVWRCQLEEPIKENLLANRLSGP